MEKFSLQKPTFDVSYFSGNFTQWYKCMKKNRTEFVSCFKNVVSFQVKTYFFEKTKICWRKLACTLALYVSKTILIITVIISFVIIIIIITIIIIIIIIIITIIIIIIITITINIIIELTNSKTILENTVEIEPQAVALEFTNLSQHSSRSK